MAGRAPTPLTRRTFALRALGWLTRSSTAAATRSFRIIDEVSDGGTAVRVFGHERPAKFSPHQCPTYDTWGVNGYNDQWAHQLGGACKPQAAWNRNAYLASNPDAWLYDINNINGWGHHEGF